VQTKLVEHGARPVVRDGVLLWDHSSETTLNELHATKLDGSMRDTMITSGVGSFSWYDVAGDNVVWSGYGPGARVRLYNLSTGQQKALSGPGGLYPLISGDKVVWTEAPNGGMTGGELTDWSIKLYDITTGALSLVTKEHDMYANAVGITGQGSIAYIKGEIYRELYTINPK
jgi:hypothetical protein